MARSNKRFITFLCAAALLLAALCSCTPRPSDAEETAEPGVSQPAESTTPTPVPELSPTPEPTPTPEPEPEYPDVPEQAVPADDEFFADAAFLGNSLVDGFRLFSGLSTCDYYAATSVSINNVSSLIDEMDAQQYGKVYILLGINEIGYDVDYFAGLYGDMLDTIKQEQPDADVYVMSLSPVSASKSASSTTFNMERVNMYNEALYKLAEEKECWYLDICSALSDESGYLPASVTTDGVHFTADHYKVWLEYLRYHYIDDGEHGDAAAGSPEESAAAG